MKPRSARRSSSINNGSSLDNLRTFLCGIACGILLVQTYWSGYNSHIIMDMVANNRNSHLSTLPSTQSSTTQSTEATAVNEKAKAIDTKNIIPTFHQRTIGWTDWPAIAHMEIGHPLVTKGDSFFHHARDYYFSKTTSHIRKHNPQHPLEGTLLDEFLDVYAQRPDPVNMCGIRINHAMALYLAVKVLQPTLVVESGVNAGVSTYFIRKASQTTKIFAIDPLDEPLCNQGKRWIDQVGVSQNLTTYYTGKANFVDLFDLDWKGMIARGEVDPESTLVFLDDHLHAYERTKHVFELGVKHVVIEDNYKFGEGATHKDKRSTPKQYFHDPKYRAQGQWLWNSITTYAEFPPLVPGTVDGNKERERKREGGFMAHKDKNDDIVAPMMRPDVNQDDMELYKYIAQRLALNPDMTNDRDSYLQFMNYNQICYLELATTTETTTSSTA